MKKTKNMNLNSDFERCKRCMYFPDISVSVQDYYIDNYGVKRRDIKYICKYDLHEIKSRDKNKCPRCHDE